MADESIVWDVMSDPFVLTNLFVMRVFILSSVFSFFNLACWLFFAFGFFRNPVTRAARRLLKIEESIVRSVMEEEGGGYAEAVLQTYERLVKSGMHTTDAMDNARRVHRKGANTEDDV